MVLVAARRIAGKAQVTRLTNSKRRRLPMPVAKIQHLEGQYSEARLDGDRLRAIDRPVLRLLVCLFHLWTTGDVWGGMAPRAQ